MKSTFDVMHELDIILSNPALDNFELMSSKLRRFMYFETNLHPISNPVVAILKRLTKNELAGAICEYAQFSTEAVHMLTDAQIRNHNWKKLRAEIERNISEEMGLETKGVPHLEMMHKGYSEELGIETDGYHASHNTRSFLYKMRQTFKSRDHAYSAGALLAFEGVAIPEFYILDEIIQEYCKKADKTLGAHGDTRAYVDGHKIYEVGHEDGLKASIADYIDQHNVHHFAQGYAAVVLTMSAWWENMANDLLAHKISMAVK